jgi:cell wall-associated NlpC family hydrolase
MVDCTDLVGTPFKFGARAPSGEFDCYGLVMECLRRNGVEVPDFGFSESQGVISAMMGVTLPQWEEIDQAPGAVVLLRVGRWVSHVGYMLDQDRMIHTWEKSGGVTIQRISEWKQQIVGFYKYVGK